MCGRYALYAPPARLADMFGTENVPDVAPRYNAAPAMDLPIIVHNRVGLARWGFPGRALLINARSETVAEKPAFAESWARRRRCLIPASGFYEWKKGEGAGAGQPYYIYRSGGDLIAFAGLWKYDGGRVVFTILTKESAGNLAALHARVPVMISPRKVAAWFAADNEGARAMIGEADTTGFSYHPVDGRVGNTANDDAALITPLTSLSSSIAVQAIPARSAS